MRRDKPTAVPSQQPAPKLRTSRGQLVAGALQEGERGDRGAGAPLQRRAPPLLSVVQRVRVLQAERQRQVWHLNTDGGR